MILCNAVPLSKEYDEELLENRNLTSTDSTDRSIIMGSPDFKAGSPNAYERLLKLSFRNAFDNPDNLSKLQLNLRKNYVEASAALRQGLSADLKSYNYYDHLKEFQFPILILHGKSDPVPLEASQRLDQLAPNSELVVFSKSGHFHFHRRAKEIYKHNHQVAG